jgi:hypothetical protein
MINKGLCYNFLKEELKLKKNDLKLLIDDLNEPKDLLKYEKKYPILRKLLFILYGFTYVSYEEIYTNCWLLLKEEEQIKKLSYLSNLLKHNQYRDNAIKDLFIDVMNDGSCEVYELNKFLLKYSVPLFVYDDKLFISEKAKKANITIYNFIHQL